MTLAMPQPDQPIQMPVLTLSHALGPALTVAGVSLLRSRLQDAIVLPSRTVVDCSAVESIDPVGAVLLWRLALELEALGAAIHLVHMSQTMINRLRNHPLKRFVSVGEELFEDPFFSPVPSSR